MSKPNKLHIRTLEADGVNLTTSFGGRLVINVTTGHTKLELVFGDELAETLTDSLDKRRAELKGA